ncbi:MAG: hypothetical protein R3B41_01230 [Candidatus Doudnabacteria bacterium]
MTKVQTDKFEQAVDRFTHWIGSVQSIILHTIIFIFSFVLVLWGVHLETILLVLTTLVSLEAIYLALFIQMTVNRNTKSLESVEEDIEEIERDIDLIERDVDEMEKDIDKIEQHDDAEHKSDDQMQETLTQIQSDLAKLAFRIESMKK